MTDPFIVWAPQRTGGTALFGLLGKFSGRVESWFEPFNRKNRAGDITATFKQTGDVKRLNADMAKRLGARIPIKNCYEIQPRPIHAACLRTACDLGFRHVILDRRDDTSRLISREIAKLTGAWGKRVAAEVYPEYLSGARTMPPLDIARCMRAFRKTQRRRLWLIEEMDKAGIAPHILFFEDVFGNQEDPEAGVNEIARLFDYLGLPRSEARYGQAVQETLQGGSQNTASLKSLVPNLEAAQDKLRSVGAAQNPWADRARASVSGKNPLDCAPGPQGITHSAST